MAPRTLEDGGHPSRRFEGRHDWERLVRVAEETSKGTRQDGAPQEPREDDEDEEYVYTTRWYWTSLLLAAGALILGLLYYDPTLPSFFVWASWFVIAVSAILVVYTAVGLVNRYRVIHRVRQRGQSLARRSGTAIRGAAKEARSRTQGSGPDMAGGMGKGLRAVRRGVVGFFKFLYRLLLRVVYVIEFLVVWILILTYDLVYAVLYAAWWVAYHVLRIAWKILYFALRVVWRILRLPLKLPGLRTLWADTMRPKILAWWDEFVATRREKRAAWVERHKRLAAARGRDPEEWHQERIQRHWFPLPLPHHAKDTLYERLEHAAETKDRRVAKGHPFKTKEEREQTRREAEEAATREDEERDDSSADDAQKADEEAADEDGGGKKGKKRKKKKRWKDKAEAADVDSRPTE